MYDKILLPVDDTTGNAEVLHHAAEIATYLDSEIRLLHVADTEQHSVTLTDQGVVDGLVGRGEGIVADAGETLETLDVEYSTDIVQGVPAETIVEYATEFGYDLIVMPTHGREGLSRYLLGSVTEKVVRLADVPVLTARMQGEDTFVFPYERILVPTDGSDPAERAGEHALALAERTDAAIHLLSVAEVPSVGPDMQSMMTDEEFQRAERAAVEAIASRAAERGVEVTTHVETGAVDEGILTAIDEHDCQAVVMGTTGRRGVDRVLLGSVAEKTVRSAPVPVVTVRGDREA
ncbi:universal stress protein [Halorhabdus rudnickae]|uniref:universal stress protein n=1 Tax=Halorhabdus rudnickae TaxID=1775544 RepID=UPI001082570A|nr:universal stress protein [Halorhabdus rudnickae]